jgi:hypothetical protein
MLVKKLVSQLGCVALVAGVMSLPAVANATATPTNNSQSVIDWDKIQNWSVNNPGGKFVNNQKVTTNINNQPEVDIQFQVGKTARFTNFGGSLTPAISSTLNGSQGANNKSLHIQMDAEAIGLQKGDNSITMTTSFKNFGGALKGVNFNLFDVDTSSIWQDRVIIKGFLGGQLISPTYSPTLGWRSATNTRSSVESVDAYTIDGRGFDANNANSDAGTVLVSFAEAIDSFELVFTDGNDIGQRNPASHGIGIGDISYSSVVAVPEPTSIVGLLAFGAIGANSLYKRKKQQA